jgi:hypothetical protein
VISVSALECLKQKWKRVVHYPVHLYHIQFGSKCDILFLWLLPLYTYQQLNILPRSCGFNTVRSPSWFLSVLNTSSWCVKGRVTNTELEPLCLRSMSSESSSSYTWTECCEAHFGIQMLLFFFFFFPTRRFCSYWVIMCSSCLLALSTCCILFRRQFLCYQATLAPCNAFLLSSLCNLYLRVTCSNDLATLHFRIFYLPVSYPKSKDQNLQSCNLNCFNSATPPEEIIKMEGVLEQSIEESVLT